MSFEPGFTDTHAITADRAAMGSGRSPSAHTTTRTVTSIFDKLWHRTMTPLPRRLLDEKRPA